MSGIVNFLTGGQAGDAAGAFPDYGSIDAQTRQRQKRGNQAVADVAAFGSNTSNNLSSKDYSNVTDYADFGSNVDPSVFGEIANARRDTILTRRSNPGIAQTLLANKVQRL